jgi:hypothetical protein
MDRLGGAWQGMDRQGKAINIVDNMAKLGEMK